MAYLPSPFTNPRISIKGYFILSLFPLNSPANQTPFSRPPKHTRCKLHPIPENTSGKNESIPTTGTAQATFHTTPLLVPHLHTQPDFASRHPHPGCLMATTSSFRKIYDFLLYFINLCKEYYQIKH